MGLNSGCGQAQYEPQSAGELSEGFPARGPVDGQLIGGGGTFSLLNEQTANRWHLVRLDSHDYEFRWAYTAPHRTRSWEYFVTKPDWNPNAPLARASFESTPFCAFQGHDKPANDPSHPKHTCTIPSDRTGHHVILAIWDVGDTASAFYKAIDVDIQAEGGPAPEWRQVSSINPHRDLKVGDKVKARAFIGGSESEQFSASIDIDSVEEGAAANWSYKLAKQLNDTQMLVSAGQKDAEGNIAPVRGANLIFAKQESGVTGYEFGFEGSPPDAYMHLHDLKPDYSLKDGEATVSFKVMTNRDLEVTATLFDADKKQVGFQSERVNDTTRPFELKAVSVGGDHVLKIVGKNVDDDVLLQEDRAVKLVEQSGDHKVFPDGLATYEAGTKVLQPKTGEMFECKPFPFSGYCKQWSPSATQYEPGVGSHFDMAWDKL